ncbi:hypothetical protein SASPL_126527 [Salvia splendens]|uniref:DUF8040 domain-containing protein n=1 Tax=Salvia splendens TaxID=180675 RepID=A0A8X8XJ58_SALSN|nr:hypothetical protein SASPL_126527 [Salvia splendens]
MPQQVRHMNRLTGVSDVSCLENLQMDRNAFGRLCIRLRQTGDVVDGRFVTVEEQAAMILGILAHHKKVRVVKFNHWRSGYTVSKYVHVVLRAVIKLHRTFWVVPEAMDDDCEDHKWKWFESCYQGEATKGQHIQGRWISPRGFGLFDASDEPPGDNFGTGTWKLRGILRARVVFIMGFP